MIKRVEIRLKSLWTAMSIILSLISLGGCAKKFSYARQLPTSQPADSIDLKYFDVYANTEYFDFEKRQRRQGDDSSSNNIERIGINYLLIEKTGAYPKKVIHISPIKYYSQVKINVLGKRTSEFSSFSREYFDKGNILDVRHFNCFRKGSYFENGRISFDTLDYWGTHQRIADQIEIDSLTLSDGELVSVNKYLQFAQVFVKVDNPKWFFSNYKSEKEYYLTPIKSMFIYGNEEKNQVYFELAEKDNFKNYVKFSNRVR
ncbi:hypothetical protein [Sphingobacterium sp. SYP-B4668]|uniref:hypothetical protein n=1 Tax=Sphingobacterium sp. SYP-B4668 TaxID=2996035 RepID=UPI0022DD1655|nr:hypothetical protein [Sphingobacterium sp. SYP-B4668]